MRQLLTKGGGHSLPNLHTYLSEEKNCRLLVCLMRLALRSDIQLVGGGGGGGGGCQWRRVLVVVVSGQVVHLQGPQHMKVTRISSLVGVSQI